MLTEAPAPPAPAAADAPATLPPGTVPAPEPAASAPPASAGPRKLVEQRVVSEEVKSRHYDDPDAEDAPDLRLMEVLPGVMTDGLALPLPYRLSVSSGYTGVAMRQASSAPARAKQYPCYPFYKPISRCMGGRS
jgi:hypothetical protein